MTRRFPFWMCLRCWEEVPRDRFRDEVIWNNEQRLTENCRPYRCGFCRSLLVLALPGQ